MALAARTTSLQAPDSGQAPATEPAFLLQRLVIRCPATGLSTDTGFELTAMAQLVGPQVLIDCLECGQDHTWQVDDAFLQ